jgi:peptide/nickel transport system substrate-binding protein
LKKLFNTAILVLILIVGITSCRVSDYILNSANIQRSISYGGENEYPANGRPIEGGTLSLFSTEPSTLNPLLTDNIYIKEYTPLIYESMVKINRKQEIIPSLAYKWVASEDNLKWTFYLYENILWQDGTPFSAEDIEFTIQMIKDPNIVTPYEKNVENIANVNIINNNTIEFTLHSPSSFTPYRLTFPIISKNYFSGEDFFSTEKNMEPMGTGPYIFSHIEHYEKSDDGIKNNLNIEPNAAIHLVRNDGWWKANPEWEYSENLPYIHEIIVKIFDDRQQEFNAFKAGVTDIMIMEKGEAAKYGLRRDINLKKYPGRYFEYLSFNTKNPILTDKAVRQAIAYALDKNVIINNNIPGEALAADLPLIPDTQFYRSNVAFFPSDSKKAREILAQGGWEDIDGIMHRNINGVYVPLSVDLIVNIENDVRCRVAEDMAKELLHIGMKVEVLKLDWNEMMRKLGNSEYGIAFIGCTIPTEPDVAFLYSSTYIPPYYVSGIPTRNTANYENEQVNELISQISDERDSEKLKGIYDKLSRIILDDLPYLGLYFYYDAVLFNNRINGNLNPNLWNPLEGLTQWYIEMDSQNLDS